MVGGGGAYVVDCVVRFHTVLVSLVNLSFQVKRGLRYHSARHWIIVISVIFYPFVSHLQECSGTKRECRMDDLSSRLESHCTCSSLCRHGWDMNECTTHCDCVWMCSGNGVGHEGARALGEALKSNNTLTSLDLGCEWIWSDRLWQWCECGPG